MTGLLGARLLAALTQPIQTLPNNADGYVITGAAGAWANGAYVEIYPATNTQARRLVSIEVEAIAGVHQLSIATGAATSEVEVASVSIATTGTKIISVEVEPGVRLAIATATKAGTAQAITLYVNYQEQ